MKYKINDIKIGDEVYFQSSDGQSNHDLYWTVTGIQEPKLMIRLNEMGYDEYWTIDISEVTSLISK